MKTNSNIKQDLTFFNDSLSRASTFFSLDKLDKQDKLHYFDQGRINSQLSTNETAVVCVHGNPSWSWYYRQYFYPEQKHRVIAIDHLGMGLSTKVSRYVSINEHAANVLLLLKNLKIRKVHLVVHDWGGVVALQALKNQDIRILSIIGMNTAFFTRKNFPWRIYLTTRPAWNSLLNKQMGVFSKAASYMTTHCRLSTEQRAAYLYPYRFAHQRQGIVNFLSDIPWFKNSKNFDALVSCEDFMKNLKIPMLAIWGLRDFCFDESYLNYWKKICPQLEIHKFFDAGHWCFEDKPHEVLKLSEKFWFKL